MYLDVVTVSSVVPELLSPATCTTVDDNKTVSNQMCATNGQTCRNGTNCSIHKTSVSTSQRTLCDSLSTNNHTLYKAHPPHIPAHVTKATDSDLELTPVEPIDVLEELNALLEDSAMDVQ